MEKASKYWENLRRLSEEWNKYQDMVRKVGEITKEKDDKRVLIKTKTNRGIEGIFFYNGHGLALQTKNKAYNLSDMTHASDLFLGKIVRGLTCFEFGEIKEMANYLKESVMN
jgi:ribonucleotide reductase beta subunit family protein with ferritin-like domain